MSVTQNLLSASGLVIYKTCRRQSCSGVVHLIKKAHIHHFRCQTGHECLHAILHQRRNHIDRWELSLVLKRCCSHYPSDIRVQVKYIMCNRTTLISGSIWNNRRTSQLHAKSHANCQVNAHGTNRALFTAFILLASWLCVMTWGAYGRNSLKMTRAEVSVVNVQCCDDDCRNGILRDKPNMTISSAFKKRAA